MSCDPDTLLKEKVKACLEAMAPAAPAPSSSSYQLPAYTTARQSEALFGRGYVVNGTAFPGSDQAVAFFKASAAADATGSTMSGAPPAAAVNSSSASSALQSPSLFGKGYVVNGKAFDSSNDAIAHFRNGGAAGGAAGSEAEETRPTPEAVANTALIALGQRVIVFGGGKQSETRGGLLRRVRLSDGMMSPSEIALLHHTLLKENPLLKRAVVTLQCFARRVTAKARKERLLKIKADDLGMTVDELKGKKKPSRNNDTDSDSD